MKILIDHCLPRRLKHHFPAHEVATAVDLGWSRLKNGDLLTAAAAGGFDLVLTIDQKMKYEQNLDTLPLSVIVLKSPSNRLEDVIQCVPAVDEALQRFQPRTLVEVSPPPQGRAEWQNGQAAHRR